MNARVYKITDVINQSNQEFCARVGEVSQNLKPSHVNTSIKRCFLKHIHSDSVKG